MANFLIHILIDAIGALVELTIVDPFPKRGESFRSWWGEKSQSRKLRTVFTWLFLAFVVSCLSALVIWFLMHLLGMV